MSDPDFRILFNSAPGLHLALLPDVPRYTVVAASDAYLHATLTRREDLLGHGLFDIFPAAARMGEAHPLAASLRSVMATGHCDAMPVRRHDLDRSAGGGVDERWWITINSPAFGTDGKLTYLIHSVEDVTKLVKLRQQDLQREAALARRPGSRQNAARAADADTWHASDETWREVVERDAASRRQREPVVPAVAAELERRVELRTRQLRRLVVELEMAESRERRRISRDLHDDLGQLLAAAGIRLAGLRLHPQEDVRRAALEIAELVEQANLSTRSLAAQLEPAVLYELGLPPALGWLAEELSLRYGLSVAVQDDGLDKPLAQETRSITYRAVRELLINVAKHAGVEEAKVSLRREGDWISVRVGDAGVGFVMEPATGAATAGMGLISVRERLSYLGGSFEIRSVPGDGTEAVLRLPLDPDQR